MKKLLFLGYASALILLTHCSEIPAGAKKTLSGANRRVPSIDSIERSTIDFAARNNSNQSIS